MSGRWLVGVWLGLVAWGCSDPEGETAGDVTGAWCGRDVATAAECMGDEVEYMELTQSGSQVTGQICEAYDEDCAPIENGKLSGSKLTFGYSPVTVGALVDLELSGDVLKGAIHSDKCACELPFTFHRL